MIHEYIDGQWWLTPIYGAGPLIVKTCGSYKFAGRHFESSS